MAGGAQVSGVELPAAQASLFPLGPRTPLAAGDDGARLRLEQGPGTLEELREGVRLHQWLYVARTARRIEELRDVEARRLSDRQAADSAAAESVVTRLV